MEKPFDRLAPHYDRLIGRFMSSRMDMMADLLSCAPEEVVLDLGGGTGLLARRLVGRCGEIHLLDESLRMLEQVRHEKIITKVGSGTKAPYPDRFFDAVILSDVLHHVHEQDLLLDEVRRMLKPGGRLLVNEVDPERFLGRMVGRIENLFFTRVFPTGFQNLSDRLESRGFQVVAELRDCWSFIGLWKRVPGFIQEASCVAGEVPLEHRQV